MLKICLKILFLICFFLPIEAKIKFSTNQSGLSFPKSSSKLILEAPMLGVTGKISFKDDDPSRVTSTNSLNVITFDNGMTGTTGNEFGYSGTIEPTGTDLYTLRTDQVIDVTDKIISQTIRIMPSYSAFIKGSPTFTNPIQMGTGSSLDLGITTPLTKPLAVEGSNTVKLSKSLKMDFGVPLNTGTLSTLNLNGFEFSFNNALSNISSIIGQGTVNFIKGRYLIDNTLTFSGLVDVSGQSSTLALGSGKSINFGPGLHDLFDVEITDLGGTSKIGVDQGGTLFLSSVTLRLKEDLILSNLGEIVILDSECKIIPNGHSIKLDHGTHLVIDGTTLFYEPASVFDGNPISVINSGSGPGILTLLNNGKILSTKYGLSIQDTLEVGAANFSALSNFYLTSNSKLKFLNSNTLTNKAITFSGNGYFIQFPPKFTGATLFEIAGNTALMLENVTLMDFNPESVLFADSNSSLTFGNNCTVHLSSDQRLTSTFPWIFTGNSYIDGNGKTITLASSQVLKVKNNAILCIKNCNIKTENLNAFLSLDDASKIIFQNCTLSINQNGLNLSTGNFSVKDRLEIFGADTASISGLATLTFSSKGNLAVESQSSLTLNKGVIFDYRANPAGNGHNTAATKRHFLLTDPSSTLHLNGCSLVSTQTALAFDVGTIFVHDLVPFKIDPSLGSEAEFGTALSVNVLAGGCLDVDGPLRYVPTTL